MFLCECTRMAYGVGLDPIVAGSSPVTRTIYCPVAQLAVRHILNVQVLGSNPSGTTKLLMDVQQTLALPRVFTPTKRRVQFPLRPPFLHIRSLKGQASGFYPEHMQVRTLSDGPIFYAPVVQRIEQQITNLLIPVRAGVGVPFYMHPSNKDSSSDSQSENRSLILRGCTNLSFEAMDNSSFY